MKQILGVLILLCWGFLVMLMGWDYKAKASHNIFVGIELLLVMGVVYWLPFWLIFC